MTGPQGPRHGARTHRSLCASGIVLGALLSLSATGVAALAQAAPSGRATTEPLASVLGDSVCVEILAAFETLEPEALRRFFDGGQVQLALGGAASAGRAVEGSFSAEQAVVLLREALATHEPRILSSTSPDDLVSPEGEVACHCPEVMPEESSAILVLHFGAVGGDDFGRRLYLDLRRQSPPSGARVLSPGPWKVRAVRDIR